MSHTGPHTAWAGASMSISTTEPGAENFTMVSLLSTAMEAVSVDTVGQEANGGKAACMSLRAASAWASPPLPSTKYLTQLPIWNVMTTLTPSSRTSP